MANTYTQLHVQFVFAVKYRAALIHKSWKEELHQYITGIVRANQHKMLQINSMPDHMHILVGMRPVQAVSALVQTIKTESSKWVNRKGFCSDHFSWQEGFGAFSYSNTHVASVVAYIQNQEAHHQNKNFLEEYKEILKMTTVPYEEQYIFKEPE